MTEKDYSLLRPFDLEAARDGAAIVALVDGGTKMEPRGFVKGPDCMGYCVVVTDEGVYRLGKAHEYRMAPLCWVKGRPVYPGDALEHTRLGEVVAKSEHANKEILVVEKYDGLAVENLTWPRPKPVKYWINIYECSCFASKAAADRDAGHTRLDCIEIELPPLKP